jgi:hypothetical protein
MLTSAERGLDYTRVTMRRLAPTLIGIVTVLVHVALIVRAAMQHTGGEFSYAVDDAYIHLALAKHLAFDGVYGVTRYAFSAASSSVVWPFLLAGAMRLFGDQVTLPLFVNLAAAAALVGVVARAIEREAPSTSVVLRTLFVVAIVLLVPVATLVVIGMEHVLHAALTVAFVLEGASIVAGAKAASDGLVGGRSATDARLLPVLAAALVGTRYEGAFPVAIAAVLLAARGRVALGVAVAAAGAAPIVLFGAYSIAHGSAFFPNPVLLKRHYFKLEELSDFGDVFGGDVLNAMSMNSYLLPLGLGLCVLLAAELRRRPGWSRNVVRLILAFGTTIAHVELANLGWFFRYEAYLVALDLSVIALAVAPVASAFSPRRAWRHSKLAFLAGGAAGALGAAPLWVRALAAQGKTPMACANIHDQQVQTARFLTRYFPHDLVAVNDIGAVTYYGSEPVLDLEGLASSMVARAKSFRLDQPLDAAQIASLANAAPVAVIYDEWFPQIPTTWVRLGRLRIDTNVVCAWSAVSVYATSGATVPRVLDALRSFGPALPAEVRTEGVWVESPPEDRARWRADTGDLLSVEVAGHPEMTSANVIDPAGSLHLPKVGEVRVRGMSLSEIAEAIRVVARRDPALANGGDVRVTLAAERACRALVTGNVARALDELVDCGTPAASLLVRAGSWRAASGGAYLWRREDGVLRRIALADDPPAIGSQGIGIQGGDIVVAQ